MQRISRTEATTEVGLHQPERLATARGSAHDAETGLHRLRFTWTCFSAGHALNFAPGSAPPKPFQGASVNDLQPGCHEIR